MTTTHNRALRLVMVRRVSTTAQASDGYGLDAQESDCQRYARKASNPKVRIVHGVVDGDERSTSGRSTIDERPGLLEALEWLQDGRADGILAPNMDRLARELTVQEAVMSYVWALGGRVFTADDGEQVEDDPRDPMRTAMRQMRGVFHQLDRAMIVKRLGEGREAKGNRGGYAFGAPRYGQQAIDSELVRNNQEAATLKRMLHWQSEGLSMRAIAARLNAEGVPSKRGGQWHPATVQRLLSPEARERARQQSARARAERKETERRTRATKTLAHYAR
ncbi:recombinase family protein [Streptomyces asoensis]|uniref:recombinase family protein n=1 Tax=Streptomyces asoensis TaxID=249586 RepID=UPI00331873FC